MTPDNELYWPWIISRGREKGRGRRERERKARIIDFNWRWFRNCKENKIKFRSKKKCAT